MQTKRVLDPYCAEKSMHHRTDTRTRPKTTGILGRTASARSQPRSPFAASTERAGIRQAIERIADGDSHRKKLSWRDPATTAVLQQTREEKTALAPPATTMEENDEKPSLIPEGEGTLKRVELLLQSYGKESKSWNPVAASDEMANKDATTAAAAATTTTMAATSPPKTTTTDYADPETPKFADMDANVEEKQDTHFAKEDGTKEGSQDDKSGNNEEEERQDNDENAEEHQSIAAETGQEEQERQVEETAGEGSAKIQQIGEDGEDAATGKERKEEDFDFSSLAASPAWALSLLAPSNVTALGETGSTESLQAQIAQSAVRAGIAALSTLEEAQRAHESLFKEALAIIRDSGGEQNPPSSAAEAIAESVGRRKRTTELSEKSEACDHLAVAAFDSLRRARRMFADAVRLDETAAVRMVQEIRKDDAIAQGVSSGHTTGGILSSPPFQNELNKSAAEIKRVATTAAADRLVGITSAAADTKGAREDQNHLLSIPHSALSPSSSSFAAGAATAPLTPSATTPMSAAASSLLQEARASSAYSSSLLERVEAQLAKTATLVRSVGTTEGKEQEVVVEYVCIEGNEDAGEAIEKDAKEEREQKGQGKAMQGKDKRQSGDGKEKEIEKAPPVAVAPLGVNEVETATHAKASPTFTAPVVATGADIKDSPACLDTGQGEAAARLRDIRNALKRFGDNNASPLASLPLAIEHEQQDKEPNTQESVRERLRRLAESTAVSMTQD